MNENNLPMNIYQTGRAEISKSWNDSASLRGTANLILCPRGTILIL